MNQVSIRTLSVAALLTGISVVAEPAAEGSSAEPMPAVAPQNRTFNVWLDEREMGQHNYSFSADGDILRVTTEANFDVKVLFVSVFSYAHTAVEHWQGNCLRAVTSTTVTNGTEEELDLELPNGECGGTYSYWDRQRLQRSSLTNAQTGEVESAEWEELGTTVLPNLYKRKRIRPDPGDVSAVELRTASATFNLYYDTQDQLLMMQTDSDGRTITYLHDSLRAK